jgi:acyl carrier protein
MYEKFVDILVEELQIDRKDITMEAELSNDLGINSIELYELVAICEDKFGIEFDDDSARKFITVGDVVNYLESL